MRFKKACLYLSLVIVIILQTENVYADLETLKDQVWNDCDAAIAEVGNLSQEDKHLFTDFLTGIIKLQLVELNVQPHFQPAFPKVADGLPNMLSLAQSLAPDHQKLAKQCALTLLPLLVPDSQFVLPELLQHSQDQTEDFSLRVRFEESALELAKRLAGNLANQSRIDPTVLGKLIQIHLTTPSAISERILSLFSGQFAESISDKLLVLSCPGDVTEISQQVSLLAIIDFKNRSARQIIAELVRKLNGEELKILLQTLEQAVPFYDELLYILLDRFNFSDLFIQNQDGVRTQIFSALNKIFEHEQKFLSFPVDPALRLKLIAAMPLGQSFERDVIEKGLRVIARFAPDFAGALKSVMESKEVDLRIRSCRLLGLVESESKSFQTLQKKLLADPDLSVRLSALESFKNNLDSKSFLNRAEGIEADLLKQFKSAKIDGKSFILATRQLLASAVSRDLDLTKKPWINLALQAARVQFDLSVPSDINNPILQVLRLNQGIVTAKALNLSDSSDFVDKNLAIWLLQNVISSRPTQISILKKLLLDASDQIAQSAELILLAIEPAAIDEFRNERPPRVSNAYENYLYETGLGILSKEQITPRFTGLSCQQLKPFAEVCFSKSQPGPLCAVILEQVARCIYSESFADLEVSRIEKVLNLAPDLAKGMVLDDGIGESKSAINLRLAMAILKTAQVSAENEAALCEVLRFNQQPDSDQYYQQLRLSAELARKCLPVLKKWFDSIGLARQEKARLFTLIVGIDASSVDVGVILADALDNQDLSLLQVIADSQLSGALIDLLSQTLQASDISVQDQLLLLKLIEQIGNKGTALLPYSVQLAGAKDPDVRYQAARNVIAGSPDAQLRSKKLKNLLGSIYFPRLLRDCNLNNLAETAKSLMDSEAANLSFLEKKDLLSLVSKLSGSNTVVMETL